MGFCILIDKARNYTGFNPIKSFKFIVGATASVVAGRVYRAACSAMVALSLSLVAPGPAGTATAETEAEYREQLRDIQQQIKRLARRLDKDVKRRNRQRDKLREVERRLHKLHQDQQQTLRELAEQQALIRESQRNIDRESQKQRAQQQDLGELVYATYMLSDRDYFKMLFSQENPYEFGRIINYYRYISAARGEEIEGIQRQLRKLTELREQQEQQHQRLGQIEQRQHDEIAAYEQVQRERDTVVAALDKQIRSADQRLETLHDDQQRLEKLLDELLEYARRMRSFDPRSNAFAKQKGKLSPPAKGRLQRRFGAPIAGSGIASQGMFIAVRDGIDVTSVYRGQVIFADWLRGFGLMIIVDHGGGYMSLYGHNKTLYKHVGDIVDTNEAIAASGTTGGLQSPGVYFEIRRQGKPINPALWCRL